LKACILAGLGFAAAQALKMFVMATFLPSADVTVFNPVQELYKSLVKLVELVGIHYTLQMTPNLAKFSHHHRILAVALGWGFVESLILYLIPLWMGARGLEFSWEFIQMAVESNINLFVHLGTVCVVWLLRRTNIEQSAQPVLITIAGLYLIQPSIVSYMTLVLQLKPVYILVVRGTVTAIMGGMAAVLLWRYSHYTVSSFKASNLKPSNVKSKIQ